MRISKNKHRTLLLAALVMLLLAGCHLIKVKGHVTTTTTVDGKTSTKTVEFDKLEDMPAAFSEATDHLAATTDQLIQKLTEAPAPGQVALKDLSPSLASYEGSKVDFLTQARQDTEKPQHFKYVQIGVPTFDMFFKSSAELHALTFQVKQAVSRVKQLAFALVERDYDANTAIATILEEALGAQPAPGKESLGQQVREGKDLLVLLANLGPTFVSKIQELVGSGQQLVAGAAASITNPKTLLHLDLIVEGVEQSLAVITESGSLLVELVEELAALVTG